MGETTGTRCASGDFAGASPAAAAEDPATTGAVAAGAGAGAAEMTYGADGATIGDKGLKISAGVFVVQVGKRKFARVTLT